MGSGLYLAACHYVYIIIHYMYISLANKIVVSWGDLSKKPKALYFRIFKSDRDEQK